MGLELRDTDLTAGTREGPSVRLSIRYGLLGLFLLFTVFETVFTSICLPLCCYDSIPEAESFIINGHVFLTVLEAGRSKQLWYLVRVWSVSPRRCLECCILQRGGTLIFSRRFGPTMLFSSKGNQSLLEGVNTRCQDTQEVR